MPDLTIPSKSHDLFLSLVLSFSIWKMGMPGPPSLSFECCKIQHDFLKMKSRFAFSVLSLQIVSQISP